MTRFRLCDPQFFSMPNFWSNTCPSSGFSWCISVAEIAIRTSSMIELCESRIKSLCIFVRALQAYLNYSVIQTKNLDQYSAFNCDVTYTNVSYFSVTTHDFINGPRCYQYDFDDGASFGTVTLYFNDLFAMLQGLIFCGFDALNLRPSKINLYILCVVDVRLFGVLTWFFGP